MDIKDLASTNSFRQQAEKIFESRAETENNTANTEAEIRQQIRELQIRQIELELENKAIMTIAEQQEALIKSEEKYRLLTTNSEEWIYWFSPTWEMKYSSLACLPISGYTPEEFIADSKLFNNIVHPADKHILEQHIKMVESNRILDLIHFRIITKQGDIKWIEHICNPIYGDDGEYWGRRGTNRDITEQKSIEEQLDETQYIFTQLYNDGSYGICMIDENFCFKMVNPSFAKMLGYNINELIGKSVIEITYRDNHVDEEIGSRKLRDRQTSIYKTEKRYIRKDGQIIWASLTAMANHDRDGDFLYILAIIEDITEQKRVSNSLEVQNALLSSIINSPAEISIFSLDAKACYTTFNEKHREGMKRIWNADIEIGKCIIDCVSGNAHINRITTGIEQTLNGNSFTEEHLYEESSLYYEFSWNPIHQQGKVIGCTVFIKNITARKLAEAETRDATEFMNKMFNLGPVAKVMYRISDRKIVNFNTGAETFSGFKAEDVIGKPIEVLNSWLDPNKREFGLELFKTQGSIRAFEVKYETPKGTEGWGSIYSEIIEQKGEKYFLTEFVDITERKQYEEKIMRLNERISTATSASGVGIWEWDFKNKIVICDEQINQMSGFTGQNCHINFEDWGSRIHPDDFKPSTEAARKAISERTDYNIEFRVIWDDNSVHWLKSNGKVFCDEDGLPSRMLGISYDITDRKIMEEKFHENEEYLRMAYESADLGIWRNDLKEGVIYFDERCRIHNGFDQNMAPIDEVIKRIHPEDVEKLANSISTTRECESEKFSMEYRINHPDGKMYWLAISVRAIFEGEKENRKWISAHGTTQDITERKLAEQALTESRAKLEAALANMTDAVYMTDEKGTIVEFNDAFATFNNFATKEECAKSMYGNMVFDQMYWRNDELTPSEEWPTQRALRGEIAKDEEYTLRNSKTGKTWIISFSFAPIRDNNGIITGTVVVARDASERIRAQQELKMSEERYRNIFESAVIGIYRSTPDGRIIMANNTLIKMLKFNSFNDLAKRNLTIEGYENYADRERFLNNIEKYGKVTSYESVWITKDGEQVYVNENSKAFYDDKGEIIYFEGTIEDITERKKMEKNLRENEAKFRNVFMINPDSVAINQLNSGIYVSINNGFTKLHGYSWEEVKDKTSLDLKIWHDRKNREQLISLLLQDGFVENFSAKLCKRDGSLVDTLVSAVMIEVEGVPCMLSSAKDISGIRIMEEALRYNEALLREVGSIAKIGGWEFKVGTRKVTWTEEVARILDLDPNMLEFDGNQTHYYTDESRKRLEQALADVIKKSKPYELELAIVTPKGNHKWIRNIGRPVIENGKVVKVVGSFQDVTERKLADQALRESEENFRTLINNMPLPVVYLDKTGKILFRNERFVQEFGYTEADVPTINEWWTRAFPDSNYREWALILL